MQIRRITPAVDEWFRVGIASLANSDDQIEYDVFPHSMVDHDDGSVTHVFTFILSLQTPEREFSFEYMARFDVASRAYVIGLARRMYVLASSEAMLSRADLDHPYAEFGAAAGDS